ncbi:MAG: hypothetical protein ACYS1E_12295, partial [Planctomycetota bacterium]
RLSNPIRRFFFIVASVRYRAPAAYQSFADDDRPGPRRRRTHSCARCESHVRCGRNSLWFMSGAAIQPGSGPVQAVDDTGWVVVGGSD